MDIKSFIRNIPDFPKQGINFKDISPLLADPSALRFAIDQIAEQWKGAGVDKIGAFDARGFIFGPAVAMQMDIPFFLIRKKGKLPFDTVGVDYDLEYGSNSVEVHVDALNAGDKILLIDDLLATGGTALAGCQLVEKLGGQVVGLQFVIELSDLPGCGVLKGYDARSLVSY